MCSKIRGQREKEKWSFFNIVMFAMKKENVYGLLLFFIGTYSFAFIMDVAMSSHSRFILPYFEYGMPHGMWSAVSLFDRFLYLTVNYFTVICIFPIYLIAISIRLFYSNFEKSKDDKAVRKYIHQMCNISACSGVISAFLLFALFQLIYRPGIHSCGHEVISGGIFILFGSFFIFSEARYIGPPIFARIFACVIMAKTASDQSLPSR